MSLAKTMNSLMQTVAAPLLMAEKRNNWATIGVFQNGRALNALSRMAV
mgnify:CR=1 FL=1